MIDGVGVALKLALQVSVDRQTSRNVFDKVGHLPVLLVLPGRSRAPMAVEAFLNHAHLFVHSLLGIFLHARVEGGVNLQTIGIEVYVHLFLVEEIAQVLGQLLSEVQRLAVVNVLYTKTQLNGHGAERVVFSLRKMSVGAQVVEHHVAALQAALRVQLGVVGRCSLQQSHQNGAFLRLELGRRRIEVSLGRRFDAERIAAEINRVDIHRQNILLVVETFQADGQDPFLRLHDHHLHSRNLAQKARGVLGAHAENVFHQLLGNGRSASCVALHHVFGSGKQTLDVNAVVLIKAFVLRVDERLVEDGSHVLILYGRTVLVEVFPNQGAVAAVDFRRFAVLGVHNRMERRRFSKKPKQVEIDGRHVGNEQQ